MRSNQRRRVLRERLCWTRAARITAKTPMLDRDRFDQPTKWNRQQKVVQQFKKSCANYVQRCVRVTNKQCFVNLASQAIMMELSNEVSACRISESHHVRSVAKAKTIAHERSAMRQCREQFCALLENGYHRVMSPTDHDSSFTRSLASCSSGSLFRSRSST